MIDQKPIILLTGPYLPGKKYGGPVKSILNLVTALKDNFTFKIVTNDRDLGDANQYSDVNISEWNDVNGVSVFYNPKKGCFWNLLKIVKSERYNLIYCSSFFAKPSVILQLLKYLGIVKTNLIVAPRGEFESAALGVKSIKKGCFLFLYKLLRTQNKMIYTCTSDQDKKNIVKTLGQDIKIFVAGNIPDRKKLDNIEKSKDPKTLRIATLSRICHIKNIKYSIELIDEISRTQTNYNKLDFHIFGHIQDNNYYDECKALADEINKRDSRNEIKFKGSIGYDDVVSTLSHYHIFLFPSKSENYGHVIHEALLAGCPVVVSDKTPWRDLEKKGIGFDIPLNNTKLFVDKIVYFLDLNDTEYKTKSEKALIYGKEITNDEKTIIQNVELINFALELK